MSWKLAQWACCLANPNGGATLKAVFDVIAGHCADKTHQCYLGAKRLADEAWMSESSARRAAQALERLGAIRIHRSPGRNANVYEIDPAWRPANPVSVTGFNPVKARGLEDDQPCQPDAATLSTGRSNPVSLTPQQNHEQDHEQNQARARLGTAEAQTAEAAAVPVGSARARTPPAAQHTPLTPRVEDARPRKPASLRSGDGAPAHAPRATPAPARAQSFDIEAWTPTPDDIVKLQAVRKDLDPEVIDEQVSRFRVDARTKGLKFRDAEEVMRRLAGWVRGTHTPRAKPAPRQPLAGARHEHEGSARHEGRASTAKAKGEAKSRGKARAKRVGPRPIPENLNLFRSCLRKGLAKEGRDVPPGVKAVAVEAVRPLYVGSGLTSRHFDKQLTRALRFGAAMLVDIDGTPMLCEPRRDGEAG